MEALGRCGWKHWGGVGGGTGEVWVEALGRCGWRHWGGVGGGTGEVWVEALGRCGWRHWGGVGGGTGEVWVEALGRCGWRHWGGVGGRLCASLLCMFMDISICEVKHSPNKKIKIVFLLLLLPNIFFSVCMCVFVLLIQFFKYFLSFLFLLLFFLICCFFLLLEFSKLLQNEHQVLQCVAIYNLVACQSKSSRVNKSLFPHLGREVQ